MIFCLSLDLDPAWCYGKIYGLDLPEEDRIAAPATDRFCQLAAELGLRGTLFVVGRSLRDKAVARAVERAASAGHEIACHSQSHPYDLSSRPAEQIEQEISGANRAIAEIVGRQPVGFRAPGYLLGSRVLGVLETLGMLYDSSVLPSPAYQGAKAAARLWLRLRGTACGSAPASLRETLAPARPYRPDPRAPWRRGSARLLELPISTLLGVPLLGGVLAAAGAARAAWLGALAAQKAWVNVELHGADLVDIETDGLPQALAIQPDFKLPWQRKADSILAFSRALLGSHRALALEQVCRLLSPATLEVD